MTFVVVYAEIDEHPARQATALALILLSVVLIVGVSEYFDYKRKPMCRWCQSRHRGRCIFNPRAGRFLANVNDGHFDVNDPNK